MAKNKPPQNRNNHPNTAKPQSQTIMTSQQWSGPLPPPAALEHFNQIIPNGAERIIRMVEQEQAHRLQYENQGIQATIRDRRRGQYMGWVISLAAIGGSVYTAYIGAHPTVSIALVSVTIGGIINAFLKK